MQKYLTQKHTLGFTLIELLIGIAIIGILAGIGIPQFNQYKIRGYDAHSKQALKDMHLICNAYWLDTDSTQGCDLPKIKDATYGFNQNADVEATLTSSPLNDFCASAKHNSSPNKYSIDSAALISEGDCSPKCFREGCKSSYTVDNPPECTVGLLEYHMLRLEHFPDISRNKYDVCADLAYAGICQHSRCMGNRSTPDTEGEIAYKKRRREHIKWGIISGDGVEWLGYESLHGPEACSYMYYGGNGWTDGCANTVDNPSLKFYLKRMAEEQNQ